MAAFAASPETTSFRGLMLMLRGRAALTQRELATSVGVSERAVQVWEAGLGYPSAGSLQRLINVYLARRAFDAGHELEQGAALWERALTEAPRLKSAFDAQWFASRIATLSDGVAEQHQSADQLAAPPSPQDWGDAPAVTTFHGRASEREQLSRWLTTDDCRLVGVLGMGGIGKTALAARLAGDLAEQFDAVFWRSLRNAPPYAEWLADAILFLSERRSVPPHGDEARLRRLLDLLRERRCLVILDNLETVLEPGYARLSYRQGYAGYGALLQALAEASHRSCLLVTSREQPPELARLESPGAPVRVMRLGGFDEEAARALLGDRGLVGTSRDWSGLVQTYGGNALALQVVGELIARVFAGDISDFLLAGEAVFGDIRRLLQEQIVRLSPVERSVLYWLALEREPVDFHTLVADFGPGVPRHDILDALQALDRRSLLELGERHATFTLQPVVLEHATDEIISLCVSEIASARPELLETHALLKAQSMEHVRRSRERMVARPVLDRLHGSQSPQAAEALLIDLLERWRDLPHQQQGFGPGNVVNLLRLIRGNLNGLDLSRLLLRQADLSLMDAQGTSLAHARLEDAIIAQQYGAAASTGISANGLYMAVGTYAGEIRVWRVLDRTPMLLERQPAGPVWDLAVSRDARQVVTCGAPGGVWLWTLDGMQNARRLESDVRELWCVDLSADGRVCVAGAGDGTVRFWNTQTGECLPSFVCHVGGVRAVQLSHDARILATGGADGGVAVWDRQTGECLRLGPYAGEIRAVSLSADGNWIAVGDAEGGVEVRNAHTGELRTELLGHSGAVWAAALTANGDMLASGGSDRTVRLWDTRSGVCQRVLFEHTAGVITTALSANGAIATSVALDGSVRVWETCQGRCLIVTKGNVPAAFEVALSADHQLAVSGGGDGDVRVWDIPSRSCMRVMRGHSAGVWSVAVSSDGQLAVSGSLDSTVRVWSLANGACLHVFKGHTIAVCSVDITPDGGLVASGGFDGGLRVWDTRSGELVLQKHCAVAGIRAVRFAADGARLASSELDGTLRLWDVRSGDCLMAVNSGSAEARAMALSGDGRLLASAHLSGDIDLWDMRTGERLRTMRSQSAGVRAVGISANGDVLVSGGVDGGLHVWATRTGDLLAELRGHSAEVWGVTVSAEGTLAISGGLDGTVRMWDLAQGGVQLCVLRPDRPYERMDVTSLEGITDIQRSGLLALGAFAR